MKLRSGPVTRDSGMKNVTLPTTSISCYELSNTSAKQVNHYAKLRGNHDPPGLLDEYC